MVFHMSKLLLRLLALACCGTFACSCAAVKLGQCRQAIAVASEANTKVRALVETDSEPSAEAMLQAATALEAAAAELRALKLRDATLRGWRQSYAPEYERLATLTREFVTAKERRDREAAEAIRDRMLAASEAEAELVRQINQYCLGDEERNVPVTKAIAPAAAGASDATY